MARCRHLTLLKHEALAINLTEYIINIAHTVWLSTLMNFQKTDLHHIRNNHFNPISLASIPHQNPQ